MFPFIILDDFVDIAIARPIPHAVAKTVCDVTSKQKANFLFVEVCRFFVAACPGKMQLGREIVLILKLFTRIR